MTWEIERAQLIDTPRSTYPDTRKWAVAIHQSDQQLDGMMWVSRRYDEERTLMLFGDRLRPDDLIAVHTVDLVTNAATLPSVHELGARSRIDIIR